MKVKTSFALSEQAINLLARIAISRGLSRSSVLELIIREKADSLELKFGREDLREVQEEVTKNSGVLPQ